MPNSDLNCVIVYTHGGGRFANQLMMFGNLIALAEEYRGLRVVDYAFWPYSDLCAGTVENRRCEYPPRAGSGAGFGVRVMGGLRRILPKRRERAVQYVGAMLLHKLMPWRSIDLLKNSQGTQLAAPEFVERLRGRRKVFLAAWNLRDWALLEKHQQAVRRFLAPAERFCKPARVLIDGLRARYEKVVGVLIRQTDYRAWANGEFFFTSNQYRVFIEQLRERFGPGTAIVLATDEVQPAGIFDGLDVAWCTGAEAGPGHYLESFAALSMCDIVVSAPSTFSAWAAFLGDVPLLPISKADDDLREVELLPRHLLDARLHWAFGRAVN